MTWRPPPLPPVPEATAAAVRAAFPKGNLSVDLRTAFGTLYEDQLFADLYAEHGRPVDVAPWRLALVMVMQDYRRAHRSAGGGCRPPLSRLEICPQP
jgi:hypothetical protein